jgi:peroxiredoxin
MALDTLAEQQASALEQEPRAAARVEAGGGTNGSRQVASVPGPGMPVRLKLTGLDGDVVTLDDFTDSRLLLVNWDPGCGYCAQIAEELAGLDHELKQVGVRLVLVARGGADPNRRLARERGLQCPILLQNEDVEVFRAVGTPVAVLLDGQHRVAAPMAVGAIAVPDLARRLASGRRRLASEKPLASSRIERNGLPAGTVAPPFELPTINGGTVRLSDYVGDKLFLVFTDTGCGPCDALAPELSRFHRDNSSGGFRLLMIGRGELEANRRKALEHRIEFTYAVQDGWQLSKKYGIFSTPAAFLIDPSGIISHDVFLGSTLILTALQDASREAGVSTLVPIWQCDD